MSTTNQNFVAIATNLSGTAATAVITSPPSQTVPFGTYLDKVATNLGTQGYPKNGGVILALAASTPVTLDLTAFATGSVSSAGDTSFATVHQIVMVNSGTTNVVVSPGGTNGFDGPMGGTSPTFTLPAGSAATWQSVAGWSVSGTSKTLTFTPPSSPASLSVCIGGA